MTPAQLNLLPARVFAGFVSLGCILPLCYGLSLLSGSEWLAGLSLTVYFGLFAVTSGCAALFTRPGRA